MNCFDIIDAWNKEADQFNQWESLSETEKVEFAYELGLRREGALDDLVDKEAV